MVFLVHGLLFYCGLLQLSVVQVVLVQDGLWFLCVGVTLGSGVSMAGMQSTGRNTVFRRMRLEKRARGTISFCWWCVDG